MICFRGLLRVRPLLLLFEVGEADSRVVGLLGGKIQHVRCKNYYLALYN